MILICIVESWHSNPIVSQSYTMRDQIIAGNRRASQLRRPTAVALAAAAKSGDPKALNLYAGQVQQARNQFDALLKDMNPQQAEAVRQVTGYYL